MTLLTRYFLRQNMGLLLLICAIGLGTYVFIDLFDRLDDFLDSGTGLQDVVAYFIYRLPFILAQIFPAVFLLALVTQFGLMARGRELLALEACAVSFGALSRSVLIYALILCGVQLTLSEFLGVHGYRAADRIADMLLNSHEVCQNLRRVESIRQAIQRLCGLASRRRQDPRLDREEILVAPDNR